MKQTLGQRALGGCQGQEVLSDLRKEIIVGGQAFCWHFQGVHIGWVGGKGDASVAAAKARLHAVLVPSGYLYQYWNL